MIIRTLLAGVLGACVASSALAQEAVFTASRIACAVAEQNVCQMGAGCTATTESLYITLDTQAQTYSRCWTDAGCRTASALFTRTPELLRVSVPDSGAMLRMQAQGGFMDVVTDGPAVAVSFGYCRAVD